MTIDDLPYSQACENNKQPILEILNSALANSQRVLEVGSGTGQHAVYFAQHLPHCTWQPTDQAHYLTGLNQRLDKQAPSNVLPAQVFNVFEDLPTGEFDALFTANTCHIMPAAGVEGLFALLSAELSSIQTVCIYGPFNEGGEFTSQSNRAFDEKLRTRDPEMGIRDKEWIQDLARQAGFTHAQSHTLPANNQLLEFHRGNLS